MRGIVISSKKKKPLALFFTLNFSVRAWYRDGSLQREIDVYTKELENYEKIYWLTYDLKDDEFQNLLPKNIIILPKKKNIDNFLYSFKMADYYSDILKGCSVFKTNQMNGSWAAVIAKKKYGKHLFVRTGFTQSLDLLCMHKVFSKDYLKYRIAEKYAYKNADSASVSSQAQYDYIKSRYNPKEINLIPNIINTKLFKPFKKKKSPSNIKSFLYVGRLDYGQKNIRNLIKAFKGVDSVRLTMIGKGKWKWDEKSWLTKYAVKNNINLKILDRVPNEKLPDYYNNCDIYIQPSLYEGNPKSILEALACGCRILSTDVIGIREVLQKEKGSLLVKTDARSIHDGIIKMIS